MSRLFSITEFSSQHHKISTAALNSRIFLIALQYISNQIIPDHNAGVFQYQKEPTETTLDKIVWHIFGGFVRWDAHYFIHIAHYGYTYEQTTAFFPFVPFLVNALASVFSYFIPYLSQGSSILLTFVILNVITFILSSLLLYNISKLIVGEKLGFKAAMLFCVNPASIFFSALYTECIYCFLTLLAVQNILLFYENYEPNKVSVFRHVLAISPLILSTLARSNGLLNIGFLVYAGICVAKKFGRKMLLTNILFMFQLITFCLIPFVMHQYYCYQIFCTDYSKELPGHVVDYGKANDFVFPGQFSRSNQTWCYKKLPFAYSYVQGHYWNVGFLRYYEIKQIPNFILAFPVIYLILSGAFDYFRKFPKSLDKLFNWHLLLMQDKTQKSTHFKPLMIVFVVHATFLLLFSIFNIHIQVLTRMLCSASPVFYWFCGSFIESEPKSLMQLARLIMSKNAKVKEKIVLLYFWGYFLVGTVMFCNFLPWT